MGRIPQKVRRGTGWKRRSRFPSAPAGAEREGYAAVLRQKYGAQRSCGSEGLPFATVCFINRSIFLHKLHPQAPNAVTGTYDTAGFLLSFMNKRRKWKGGEYNMASSSHMGGSHKGNSKKRSETTTSKTGRRIKRDASTGQFMSDKSSGSKEKH